MTGKIVTGNGDLDSLKKNILLPMSLHNETRTLLLAVLWKFTTIWIIASVLNSTSMSEFAADIRVNNRGDSGCFSADLIQRM